MAKRRMGVPANELVCVRFYPEPEDSFSAFLKLLHHLSQSAKWQNFYNRISAQIPLWDALPAEVKGQINYLLRLSRIASAEGVVIALPFKLNIN
ncbi:MAG: hypothetical protein GXO75_15980 [Calditrichaeota bacterium]|nr:hypothetical protein [Calditrichota bacterium]